VAEPSETVKSGAFRLSCPGRTPRLQAGSKASGRRRMKMRERRDGTYL